MEANKHGGKRAGAGRPAGTTKGVTPSKTVRVSQDVANLIRERFKDTTNQRLKTWINKLP